MSTTAAIQIGDHTVSLQCFAHTSDRDQSCPGITATPGPLSVDSWPITPAELATRANSRLAGCGASPSRLDDCVWAATSQITETHYWKIAETATKRQKGHAAGRRAYLRGEVS